MKSCTVFDIKKYAIHDGPGIRTTIFFKGCPLSCIWCHNPEGISLSGEILYQNRKCIGCLACIDSCQNGALKMTSDGVKRDESICIRCGICADACPASAMERVGRPYTTAELIKIIEKDIPFYESSEGGVTFSGGEPLTQWEALVELLRGCRDIDIHTAVDTTGFASWSIIERAAEYADLFLFDLKHMDSSEHRKYTGVPNELILSNLQKLASIGAGITIRIPLIPGVNDGDENIDATGRFIAALPGQGEKRGKRRVTLMPYHDFQKAKYTKFKMEYRAASITPPDKESVISIQKRLETFGLLVEI